MLRWQGHRWQPLAPDPVAGAAPPAQGSSLTSIVVTAAGDLVALGRFPTTSLNAGEEVARWTGTGWLALGAPAEGYRKTFSLALTATGELLASGSLVSFPYKEVFFVARWDGQHWQPLPPGPLGVPDRVLATPAGEVVVSSNAAAGNKVSTSVARWNGIRWQTYFLGEADITHRRQALAVAANGDIIVSDPVYGLLGRNNRTWYALTDAQTAGFPGVYLHAGYLAAVAVAPGGAVVLVGSFYDDVPDTLSPHQLHHRVCRWDGQRRQPLGPELVGAVQALAVAPNGDVLAGSRFTKMPGDPHERTTEAAVMRWNGQAWQALTTTSYPYVQSPALARDGSFVLGTGVTSSVHSFSQSSGEVYHLSAAGGPQVGHSLGGYVYAVAIAANGDIIAGGDFNGYLLRWNGTAWQPLGSGVNGPVRALAVAPNGELIVGGSFSTTNDGTQSLSLWGIYRP